MAGEIEALRAELDGVTAKLEALADDRSEPAQELRSLLARQALMLRDTMTTRSALHRLRRTFAWRALETARRQRLRARQGVMALRSLRRPWRAKPPVPPSVRRAPLGVNVAGYLNTESGMGEAARLSVRSLDAAGVPMALNNVPSRLRMDDTSCSGFSETNPHPFNLVHLNADNMESFARARGPEYFRDRYTIGYWFWELAEFRKDWLPAFRYVDEVWVASAFGRAALAGLAPVPVSHVPLPVVPPPDSPFGRLHFGLGPDVFVFLFTFDVSSQVERKNPRGLVEAFRQAFGDRKDVVLVLKFTNAEYDPRSVARLYAAIEGLNVVALEGYMTRAELAGLMRAADCYVSLHRSEGLGLGIGEAMALGKPVVATGYSGIAEILTPANSYPVRYGIVSIPRDYGPYLEGLSWAEPDLEHASALMRQVVDDEAGRMERGRRAVADMARCRAPRITGMRARLRLEEIRSGSRFGSALGPAEAPASP
jgi:glycosyltransferase involved in cell wall biosynthesis